MGYVAYDSISISGDGTKVAWSGFVSVSPSVAEEELFVANTDGTGIRRITDDSATATPFTRIVDIYPSLSGDGSKVAWERHSGEVGNGVIFVANTDGSGMQQLSNSSYGENRYRDDARYPSISADGSNVAWSSVPFSSLPNLPHISVGKTNSSRVVTVSGSEYGSGRLSLAADGKKVAFVKPTQIIDGKGTFGLFVGDADGTGTPTLIDIGNTWGNSTWDFGGSVGDGPSLSSYVNIGVRYLSFDPITGSGEINTWGPSHISFSNIERFNLTGTHYGDELYGGNSNDTLTGSGGADTLKAGLGDDTYVLNAQTAAGSQIQDTGGADILNLTDITLSLAVPNADLAGLQRNDTTLMIDLNTDGVITANNDLAILDFFASTGTGAGFIETVGNLSGSSIFNLLGTPVD